MKMDFDISKIVEELVMQATETQEEFIIETIHPYCENILQIKINKEELKQMLLKSMQSPQPCEDWYDVPSDEMTLEQARQAVKDLRKKLAEYLEQQPCEDYVNREAVAEMLNEMPMKITETWMDFYRKALNSLNKLPSVTPTISKMEQVEDCISRQALIDELEEPMNWTDSEAELQEQRDYEGFIELLKSMPSVTPSRPRGKWIREKRDFLLVYRCSNCKKIIYSRETISDAKYEDLSRVDSYRYCPRCGANMMESEDKE